ncbi:MAG: sigma-70 family RNA polymerase sigma factor [Planctomycetota bacterium]|nr:sigma-70 family RNA polymerase sigma factor [Planctomycetota bacterium]MDA1221780.1 sigma-70 family RNA polymerase sigma factor [Planctomycetota bacterium]
MTIDPQTPDRELIEACQDVQDDRFEAAFEELYRRYRDRVYSIAYRITGSTTDAMDVVQESFRVLFLKISTFRFDARFSTWLFRIVVNCSIDHRRRERQRSGRIGQSLQHLHEGSEPVDDGKDPLSSAETSELGEQVQVAISRLSPKLRAILVLRYLEGLSYDEIAETLEVQLGTVKSRLARAHLAIEQVLSSKAKSLGMSVRDHIERSGGEDEREGVA